MRHALAIARRELESYFVSPIAAAVMAVFTFVSGLFFSNMLVHYIRQAALADSQIQRLGRSDYQLDVPTTVLAQFFQNEAFLLMLAVPLLTMGLMTDERRKGTIELLMTSPVRASEIVAGKFLGAIALLALMLAPLVPMFAFMGAGNHWEAGVIASGLMGLLLVGGAQIALGLFVSSLCEHVLVSAIGTYGIVVTLQFIDTTGGGSGSVWARMLGAFSFYARQIDSTRGVVSVADLVYFASWIVMALFLAQRAVEALRFERT
ncbi:MAG TPA: ABC transporter permease [Vicinamibacterales bacterium]|nr:ABC transporter permease [Vicinamibacterales bacterium]HOG28455.1 ABC transporter permease [Vicinamibacterales bacterium]HOQ59132.1 ABC transporter permease [Vicinamibacterales bacterium]HPK70670.1 ABC transporter permease [Vicinamibacterales bacterium]HPW19647.1 ABC transporter permease [Vicinamibacterales bacterium]